MANAMFRELTHGVAARSGADTPVGPNAERESHSDRRAASPKSSADAAGELRAWLLHFNALLESPCSRESVASEILRILQHFFPAQQSALFLADPGSEVLFVAAARGTEMSIAEAEWVERTARESLSRCDVLGRETSCGSLSSFLWVPVLSEGRSIGVIEMGDCSGHWFSGGQTRELSRLADDVGALLMRLGEIANHEAKIGGLQRDLSAGARQGREMERRIIAGAGRETVFEMATSIAERATDPVSYVLSNLRSVRDEVESMQNVIGTLVETARALMERLPSEFESSEAHDLRAALATADANQFREFLADLGPLIDDVEEGTSRLQLIGADFHELALGETAPMYWINVSDVIERALAVVVRRETVEHGIEVRVSDIPPMRCQRLRIECLLIDMLARALAIATPDSAVAIQADLRGSQVIIEVSVDLIDGEIGQLDTSGDKCSRPSDLAAECLRAEHVRLSRDIAEDHGGQISVETLDDLVVTRLVLPVDRD